MVSQYTLSGDTVNMAVPMQDNHDALRGVMQRSTFCLVIPGDTASSRRLTEIILAGCIPVFVGSPWHSMPLAALLDYPKFALFVELEQLVWVTAYAHSHNAICSKRPNFCGQSQVPWRRTGSWSCTGEWYRHRCFSTRMVRYSPLLHFFVAENIVSFSLFRWIADADITSNVYHVANVSSMVDYLRSIRPSELHALQQNGVAARSLFRYQSHLEPQIKTVPDVIMQTICAQYVKNIVWGILYTSVIHTLGTLLKQRIFLT